MDTIFNPVTASSTVDFLLRTSGDFETLKVAHPYSHNHAFGTVMAARRLLVIALLLASFLLGCKKDRDDSSSKRRRNTPEQVYRKRNRYIRDGNGGDLYDLYGSTTHTFFRETGDAAGMTGREAFKKSFFPHLQRMRFRKFPSDPDIDIDGDRATIKAPLGRPLGAFSADIHLVREDGEWKLEMPERFREFVTNFGKLKKRIDDDRRRIKDRNDKLKSGRQKLVFPSAVKWIPPKGLLSTKGWKIHYRSSEDKDGGHIATNIFDGNSRTIWHSQHRPLSQRKKYPHVLVIDLGAERTVRGFRYLARQDISWSGALKQCAFYISNEPGKFDNPSVTATFKRTKGIPRKLPAPPPKGATSASICFRKSAAANTPPSPNSASSASSVGVPIADDVTVSAETGFHSSSGQR